MKYRHAILSAMLLTAGLGTCSAGVTAMAEETAVETTATEAQTEKKEETIVLGFTKSDDKVTIYKDRDPESAVAGRIATNGKLDVIGEKIEGWYHVKSGNVDGYIDAKYVVTGEEADKLAATTGYTTAKVGALTLNVRSNASDEGEVVDYALEGETLEVVDKTSEEWVKVITDDGVYGYISTDYAEVRTEYRLAETPEEEAQREGIETAVTETTVSSVESDNADTGYTAPETELYVEPETSAPQNEPYVEPETYAQETEAYVEPETYAQETEAYVEPETYAQETEAYVEPETYAQETEAYVEPETYAPETEAPAPAASSTGQEIANYACQFVGNPYVYGGSSLTSGTDCSGFTMSVYSAFGISLPHYSGSQMGYGSAVDASSLAPGDLVFYGAGGSQHVAIYIGGGSIVHAANENVGIVITGIDWPGTPTGYRRIV